jgi:transposase
MGKRAWIAIDVSMKSFQASIADDSAAVRHWSSLPSANFEHSAVGMKQFVMWAKGQGWNSQNVVGICIEATGRHTQRWVELYKGRLGPVCIVNPARPKAFAKSLGIKDKSDRVDACVLALYAKATQPKPAPVDSASVRELRELCRLRNALEAQRQANQQRLADGPCSALVRAALKRSMTAQRREIQQLDKAMYELIRNDATMYKDFKRAKTIKGIGPRSATVILAEFGDLRRYNRDQLVALAGLYPREYTSGTSVRKRPRLAKAGKAPVRAALYMAAMSAIQADLNHRRFAQRLKENGKNPMQILGAVMRKLLMLVHAVVVSETDYDPNYQMRVQSQTA